MTRLAWNATGSQFYQTGIDRGVLYVDGAGVVWNGLTSVDEAPSGGEIREYYFDGVKYLQVASRENFVATLNAFYSPKEFDACDGVASIGNGLFATQQPRKPFGLSYRTRIGNDVEGEDYAYKIHLVYDALASPAQKQYVTASNSTSPTDLSWSISTKPRLVPGLSAPTGHLVVDTSQSDAYVIGLLEDILYGSDAGAPRLPSPEEMIDLFQNFGPLEVIDNGDGTWTATGNAQTVKVLTEDTFQIASSSADMLDDDKYTLTSL